MTIGERIGQLRRKAGLTQEALAQRLSITNQAVSKWESGQSCPDIELLPYLADTFGVTIDALFGREVPAALPWEKDETLRVVLYVGHQQIAAHPLAQDICFCYEGPALNIHSALSIQCDDVAGNVTTGGSVTCDHVEGDIHAQGSVTCDAVHGDIRAGGNVTCDEVHGDVHCGGNFTADHVGGAITAGGAPS